MLGGSDPPPPANYHRGTFLHCHKIGPWPIRAKGQESSTLPALQKHCCCPALSPSAANSQGTANICSRPAPPAIGRRRCEERGFGAGWLVTGGWDSLS